MIKKIFLYVIVFLTNISVAQYVNYTNDTGWNLGINIGGSWQEPERKNNNSAFNNPFAGFSRGFTVGKGVYENKDKFFSVDLRFRYLKGKNSGWTATADSFASPYGFYSTNFILDDSVYAYTNYQMKFNEFTFEGVLTLNKLREKTGLILYGFGGIGLTYYNINRDILNETSDSTFNGDPYDYSSLTFISDRQTARDLKRLSDNNFETKIETNKLKFMPSLGFGIGYQFNERWSIGVEHKITYALSNNINDIDNSQINDKYHYTALKLNFDISSNKPTLSYNNQYVPESSTPINSNPPLNQGRPPLVERVNPSDNFYTSRVPTINFSNSIYNLEDNFSDGNNYNSTRSDIEFSVNGYNSKNYRFKNDILYSNINLSPGENIIRVRGINQFGSDFKTTTIYYNAPSLQEPPTVKITVPNTSPYISSAPYSAIHASILNIVDRSQITFKINGERIYNFSFNGEYFSANNIPLNNGNNIFQISASNNYGYATDETIVFYSSPLPKPMVDITNPYTNPYNSLNSTTSLRATILNVENKYNVEFYINGNRSYEFDFSATQFKAKLIRLVPGKNRIRIVGKNNVGLAEDNTTIIYNNSLLPKPLVNITNPSKNPYVSNNNKTKIYADVFNVLNSADILFYINNIKNTNFSFSGNKFEAVEVLLKTGKNYIKIVGANNQGSSFDETIVIYKPPTFPLPKVRFTSPTKSPSEVVSRFIKVDANILNVVGENNITFSVNGGLLTKFNFSGNKFVAKNVVLKNGKNIIRIKGQNNQGSAFDESIVFYKPIVTPKPNVKITSPGLSPFNSPSLYVNIRATILNVSSPKNVTFKLNGVLHNNFTFSGNIFEASNILIKEGNNTINISGRNSAGIDYDQRIISYRKPTQNKPPKIVVSYPSSSSFNTNNKMILISGQIQNVENANNVSVTMNGNTVKNFLFDTYFDDFQSEIQLQNGINIFNIKAFNNDGKDESIVSIKYAPIECKNPIINLKSPNSNSVTASSSRGYISAVINNTQNVIFKIDGVASQGFNFNVNNGVFTSMINLSPGTHDYEINAFNTCGSASEIISFAYGNLPSNGTNNNEEKELNEETKEEQIRVKEEDNEDDEKEEDNEKSINEEKMLLELKQKKAIVEAQKRKQLEDQKAVEKKRKRQQQEQQAAEEQRRQQQKQQAAEEQRKQQQKQQAAEEQRRQQQKQQAAEEQRKQQQKQQAAEEQRKQQQKQQAAEEQRRQQQKQQAAEEQRRQQQKQQAAEEQRRQQQKQQAAEEQRRQQQKQQAAEEQKANEEQNSNEEQNRKEQKQKEQARLKKQAAEKKKAEAAKGKQTNNKKSGGS